MDSRGGDAPLQPWTVSEAGYPATGQPSEKLRFLLRYAILAPSGHNTQPWLFRLRDQRLQVYAERARALPVVDPEDQELTISCVASLVTLSITHRAFVSA